MSKLLYTSDCCGKPIDILGYCMECGEGAWIKYTDTALNDLQLKDSEAKNG